MQYDTTFKSQEDFGPDRGHVIPFYLVQKINPFPCYRTITTHGFIKKGQTENECPLKAQNGICSQGGSDKKLHPRRKTRVKQVAVGTKQSN